MWATSPERDHLEIRLPRVESYRVPRVDARASFTYTNKGRNGEESDAAKAYRPEALHHSGEASSRGAEAAKGEAGVGELTWWWRGGIRTHEAWCEHACPVVS